MIPADDRASGRTAPRGGTRALAVAVAGVVMAGAVLGLVAWWTRDDPAATSIVLQRAAHSARAGDREPAATVAAVATAAAVADTGTDAPLIPIERTVADVRTRRHGVLLDARTGVPIAGAQIGWPLSAPGGLLDRDVLSLQRQQTLSTSDEAGRFAVEVPAGTWLVVAAAGFAPCEVAGDTLGSEPEQARTLQLTLPGRLRAQVVDVAGAAAAGIEVRLLDVHDGFTWVVEATTDARGEALLADVPPDREWTLELAEGMAWWWRDYVKTRLEPGERLVRRVPLHEEQILSVRVLDWLGEPVEHAQIHAKFVRRTEHPAADAALVAAARAKLPYSWRWSSHGSTGPDGRYRGVEAWAAQGGWWVIGVAGSDDRPAESAHAPETVVVTVAAGQRSIGAVLVVEPGAVVRGRLLQPDGTTETAGLVTGVPVRDGHPRTDRTGELRSGTDDDGGFDFVGLEPGAALWLSARTHDSTTSTRREVFARAGGPEVVLQLATRQGAVIRARDAAGEWRSIASVRSSAPGCGFASLEPHIADESDERDDRRLEVLAESSGSLGGRRRPEEGVPWSTFDGVFDLLVRTHDGRVGALAGVVIDSTREARLDVIVRPAAWLEIAGVDLEIGRVSSPAVDCVRVVQDGCVLWRGSTYRTVRLRLPSGKLELEWGDPVRQTQALELAAGMLQQLTQPPP